MVYVVNVVLILCYSIMFLTRATNLKRKIFCTLCFIQLFLIGAFRFEVGADYFSYIREYLRIGKESFFSFSSLNWLSPGFILVNKIIFVFFEENYLWMFAFFSFATVFFIIRSIYKNSCDVFLSVYLYISFCLYYHSFNQMRQALAIAITTYSYQYVRDRKPKEFLICILAATLMHYSALVFIIVYFLRDIKVSRKNLVAYIVICVGAFFSMGVIEFIISFTPYSKFLGSQYDVAFSVSTIFNLLYRIILVIGTLLFARKVIAKNYKLNLLYNIGFLCLFFQILTIRSASIGRITTYFYIFYIFLIPEVIYSIKNKHLRVITLIGVVILASLYHYVYYTYVNGDMYGGHYRYQSIFSSFF